MDELEAYKNYLLEQGTDPKEVQEYGEYLRSQGALPPAAPESKPGEAFLQGFGQGGTLGYLPEIQARTEQGLNAILPQSMGGSKGFNTGDESYEQILARNRGRDQSLKDSNPIASGVGNVAGAVATLPVGGAAAKGASTAMKVARGAGTGAAYGGAMNPELDPNASTEENLKARLENAGYGAAFGGAGEGLMLGGGKMLKKLGDNLKNSSVLKQISANSGQIKKILQKDELPKIDNFLQEEKLMKLGKDTDAVVEKTQQILDTDGPAIGQLYEDAQAAAQTVGIGQPNRISGPELADEILNNAKAKYKTHANRDMVMKELEQAVAPLRDMGDSANIVDVHKYRKSLDENINWSQKAQERDAVQNAFIDARNAVADKSKNAIESIDQSLGTEQTALLKKLNARYSTASTVNNIAQQGAAREKARAFLGQGVLGVGAGGIAATAEMQRSGDPLKAVASGIATSVGVTAARKYGTPITYGAGKAASAIGRGAQHIANRPGELATGLTSPWIQMNQREK